MECVCLYILETMRIVPLRQFEFTNGITNENIKNNNIKYFFGNPVSKN